MTRRTRANRLEKQRVFVSHGSRDAELARRFERELKKLGLQPLSPAQEMSAGATFRTSVANAIERSDAMVIVTSAPYSLSSGWTSYEAGAAEALGKDVFLLLPDRYPVAEVPEDFASLPIVAFDPAAPEGAAREIASRLAAG